MREQTINISGLRSKTRQVITQVRSRGQSFVVEILGKPVAAIVGLDEYQELLKLKRARAAPAALRVNSPSRAAQRADGSRGDGTGTRNPTSVNAMICSHPRHQHPR